jgi:transcriptional regulator with XRE-family HTH domain
MKHKQKHTLHLPRFFNLFRTKRKQLGLTQKDIASFMGLATPAHISEYERGGKAPSLPRLIEFAIILHEPRLDVLFPDLYEHCRQQIMTRRMRLENTTISIQ